MPLRKHRQALDDLYRTYCRREFAHPDPIEFVYEHDDPADREIAAFVAAALAYGRVMQILRSVRNLLDRMGDAPVRFVLDNSPATIHHRMDGFKHRFNTADDVSALLVGLGRLVRRHGSLNKAFVSHMQTGERTVVPATARFADELSQASGGGRNYLIVSPAGGSACKRMNLFLRWMVRHDAVDPGGWRGVPVESLVAPLDTHMHRLARLLGATARKSADLRTALEITEAFRRISPQDPVRYDFALTRRGICPRADKDAFFRRCGLSRRIYPPARRGPFGPSWRQS